MLGHKPGRCDHRGNLEIAVVSRQRSQRRRRRGGRSIARARQRSPVEPFERRQTIHGVRRKIGCQIIKSAQRRPVVDMAARRMRRARHHRKRGQGAQSHQTGPDHTGPQQRTHLASENDVLIGLLYVTIRVRRQAVRALHHLRVGRRTHLHQLRYDLQPSPRDSTLARQIVASRQTPTSSHRRPSALSACNRASRDLRATTPADAVHKVHTPTPHTPIRIPSAAPQIPQLSAPQPIGPPATPVSPATHLIGIKRFPYSGVRRAHALNRPIGR